MPSSPLGEEGFARLKQAIIERTGHFYYDDKEDLLWERVRRRLAATRLTTARYLDRLVGDAGEAEWAALEAELTIGETYFFRYEEQFAALRETILPAIIEARAEDRRLRIWSAGCATGAEPYSLAILLHDLLSDQLSQWRVSILGTDINEPFLAAAREAKFGRWALRSLSDEQIRSWFDADGRDWRLKPQFRGMVRFQRGNLLDLLGPAPPLELADFDLILCRNVLIYFHPAKVAEVAAALTARLRSEGWLLVGHAEPNPQFAQIAKAVALPGTVAYRPLDAAALAARHTPPPQVPPPQVLTAQVPPVTAWTPLFAPVAPEPAISVLQPLQAPRTLDRAPPLRPEEPLDEAISEIRRRADVGDFDGAEHKCRECLTAHPDHPVLHFYAGLLDQSVGRLASAEDALRRALYLDPSFVMAQYHLGLVRLARGLTEAGRKAVATAAQMAGTLALAERLPEGAGLTAGELRELARVQLGTIGGRTHGH